MGLNSFLVLLLLQASAVVSLMVSSHHLDALQALSFNMQHLPMMSSFWLNDAAIQASNAVAELATNLPESFAPAIDAVAGIAVQASSAAADHELRDVVNVVAPIIKSSSRLSPEQIAELARTGGLSGKVEAWIASDPALSGSTTEYVQGLLKTPLLSKIQLLYDPFTGGRKFIEDAVTTNPDLAKPTSQYLGDTYINLLNKVFSSEGYGGNVERLLKQNPRLGGSTTAYMDDMITSWGEAFRAGVGKKVEMSLDANPDYKKSTSQFVMEKIGKLEGYVPKVKVEIAGTGEFLAKSPLVQDTNELFSKSTSEFVTIFKDKFDKAADPNLGPVYDYFDAAKEGLGENLNGGFQSQLDANPVLAKSTSEALSDVFGIGIGNQGDLGDLNGGNIDTGSLAINTVTVTPPASVGGGALLTPLTQGSTSASGAISTGVGVPGLGEGGGDAGVEDTINVLSNGLSTGLNSGLSSIKSAVTALPTIPTIPKVVDIDIHITSLTNSYPHVDISKVGSKVGGLVEATGVGISRGSAHLANNLGAELGEKGEILVTGIAAGAKNFIGGIGEIFNGFLTIGVPKIANVFDYFADSVPSTAQATSEAVQKAVTGVIDSAQSGETGAALGDATKASATAIANKVGQWRLFSDENHMKNGYWETVYTSLSTAARKTSTEIQQNPEYINQQAQALTKAAVSFTESAGTKSIEQVNALGSELVKIGERTAVAVAPAAQKLRN